MNTSVPGGASSIAVGDLDAEPSLEDVHHLILVDVHVQRWALAGRRDALERAQCPVGLLCAQLEGDVSANRVLDGGTLTGRQMDSARGVLGHDPVSLRSSVPVSRGLARMRGPSPHIRSGHAGCGVPARSPATSVRTSKTVLSRSSIERPTAS